MEIKQLKISAKTGDPKFLNYPPNQDFTEKVKSHSLKVPQMADLAQILNFDPDQMDEQEAEITVSQDNTPRMSLKPPLSPKSVAKYCNRNSLNSAIDEP